MKTAYLYLRVSTKDQSTEHQKFALENYAKFNNLKVLKIYDDSGISGIVAGADRPEFKKMLDDIKTVKPSYILTFELSRFGRSATDVLNNIKIITDLGITIYFEKEKLEAAQNGTATSKLLLHILSAVSEIERETIKDRMSSGRLTKASLGFSGGFINVYGYDNKNTKIVVNEKEAKVIKLIFKKFNEGNSSIEIERYLNANKIPTKKNTAKWKYQTIDHILRNRCLIGERKYNDNIFPITPIIDIETFEKAQTRILKRKENKTKVNTVNINLLKGLMVCSCGQHFNLLQNLNKETNYKCYSFKTDKPCGTSSISTIKFDKAVIHLIKGGILKNTIKENIINVNDYENQINDLNEKINNNLINVDGLSSQIRNYNRQLSLGLISEIDAINEINELKISIDRILKANELLNTELKNKKDVIENQEIYKKEYHKILENPELLKDYIKLIVEKIEIRNIPNDFKVFKHKRDVKIFDCKLILLGGNKIINFQVAPRSERIRFKEYNEVLKKEVWLNEDLLIKPKEKTKKEVPKIPNYSKKKLIF
jgi:site-specific DNA recombinase